MSIITDILSGGASKLIDSIGNVLDNVITTKEEKQTLDNEIMKAEMEFQLELAKMSIQEQQAVLGDVQNARQRDIQIQTSSETTKFNKQLMPILTLATIGIVFILFFVIVFVPTAIKQESKEIIMYILGVVSTILVQVYSYYFGSSAGSVRHAETIANLQKTST